MIRDSFITSMHYNDEVFPKRESCTMLQRINAWCVFYFFTFSFLAVLARVGFFSLIFFTNDILRNLNLNKI